MRTGADIVRDYASKGQDLSRASNQPKTLPRPTPISSVVKNKSPKSSASTTSSGGSKLGMVGHVAGSIGGAMLASHPLGRTVIGVYRMAVKAANNYKKKNGLL